MGPFSAKDIWAAGALYEPYVGRWSRLVARELMKWLSLPAQKDWLDVGCGTGALSQIILERGRPRAIKGIDASAGFLAYAKAHVESGCVTFEVGDARALPIDSASFDAVTTFRNFDDYWSPFLGGQGPVPSYAMSLSEERRETLRERIRSNLPTANDGSIPLTVRAWAVRGRMP